MMGKEEVILGIPLRTFSKKEVLSFARSSFEGNSFHRIATVGPEFLLLARESEEFRKNLLAADLRIADGFGITLAGWLQGKRIRRFPGADLLHKILKEVETRKLSVFLAIQKGGLSSLQEIQNSLLKKYPRLEVTGKEFEKTTHSSLLATHDSLVLCNFGAPQQEYFLESLRGRSEHVKLVMGIGGAFDFLTGKLPRAPRPFRAFGLEWLWRLFLQPARWRRIWRAVFVFPVCVIKERFF